MTDKNLADYKDWSEHYIKRGDPKKPTYYIIRRRLGTNVGLFSNFLVFAGHIRYALSNGWLPVIDMQNYPNSYLPPEKLGKENSWEYYFEQPLRIGLDQAYSGENVILGIGDDPPSPIPPWNKIKFYEAQDTVTEEWRMLVKLGLLKVKPERMKEISALRQKLFAPNDRVLGVHLRGTDYLTGRGFNHPIPPPIEFALSTVVAKLQEWRCNKIFLATEDKEIVSVFKNVFRDFCVIIDKDYINHKPGNFVSATRIDRPNDHFLQGKEYLTEMMLLTMCNSFVTARCSGATGVMMLSNMFENVYAFNLGRYGVIGLD